MSEAYLSDLYRYATRDVVAVSDAISFDDETKVFDKDNALHRDFVRKSCRKVYGIVEARKFYSAPVRKLVSRKIINNRLFDTNFKNGEDTLFFFLISDRVVKTRPSSGAAVYYRRCRATSAHFAKKTRTEKIKLGLSLINTLSRYYFKNPIHYNVVFFITRILGSVKIMIE